MSYCIKYNPELKRKYPNFRQSKNKSVIKVMIVLIMCVGAYMLVQSDLVHYLLPGNSQVTASAFSTMVQYLHEGSSMKDAVLAFCEEVVINSGK